MRQLLLINPNTSVATTERLAHTLRPLLPDGVHLALRTASFGARYIACEASHAVAGAAVLETWAEHLASPESEASPPQGVLIGCFGDPGLFALRESSACPVTGLAEASFIEAARHGGFAIVTGGERWKPMLRRLALSLGYGEQLLHIETVAPTGAELQADPQAALRHLHQACRAAARPGVASIIVGGAGLAGYAQRLQPEVALPLIDSAQAGLKVLLERSAPPPQRATDGFFAEWSAVSPSMARLGSGPG
ncbi:aspartate/glutamate racemase family protein [Piscinibacter sp. HJYY11]|uniref:aspartate/glutamate racemase family protein n=1 Tax=Piscinibacter sp. HJYY11 TaxID=2801333 RepID=UPI00191FCB5D|nr:aspartate/glutamate racemase family protein [Piscinibacter sp. HJYY11]MBL0727617.1 Asp/Glu racemase [Piscinibacter sp. HJYY11]